MPLGRQLPAPETRRQVRICVKGLLNRSDRKPGFVVFCRGRDGSTLLVDLLNQLPEVHCDGEILHTRVPAPRLYIDGCRSVASRPVYGFKLLSHHLTHIQSVPDAGRFLRDLDNKGYRIIHLRRQNMLRQVLSNFYVRHRGGYAGGHQHHRSADGVPNVTRMQVDVAELDYWLRENERRAGNEEAAVSGLRTLDLVYERDLQHAENHQDTIERAAEYLGVRSAQVRAGLARLTTDDLAEFIANHDEVVQYLEQTDYRRYLSAT